jgi:exodeoxyribonuclease V alpha subunit
LHGLGERVGATLALERWVGQLGPARTLHSLLGTRPGTRRFRHDASNPLDVDLLFVDEASMVHLEMMALLLEALPARARVVLLGDKDQLASVEAGAVMGELCQGAEAGYRPETAEWIDQVAGQVLPATARGAGSALAQQTVVLRRSHRFDGPIGQLALAVNRGDAPQAWALLHTDARGPVASVAARDASAPVTLALGGRAGAVGGYRLYLERLARRPPLADADRSVFEAWARAVLRDFDGFRVLCAVRDGAWGVSGLNLAIERALQEAGLLARRGEWYEGRPVVVTRNDAALGVFNGDIGIVLRAPEIDGGLRCWFLEGDELHSVAVARLAEVETAFAMTVHKSQGSEFEHVVLVLPDEDQAVLTRELIYTGITRARTAFTLVAKQPGLLASATGRLTRRVSGLSPML